MLFIPLFVVVIRHVEYPAIAGIETLTVLFQMSLYPVWIANCFLNGRHYFGHRNVRGPSISGIVNAEEDTPVFVDKRMAYEFGKRGEFAGGSTDTEDAVLEGFKRVCGWNIELHPEPVPFNCVVIYVETGGEQFRAQKK